MHSKPNPEAQGKRNELSELEEVKMKKVILLLFVSALLTVQAQAVLIGTWEGGTDGWISWGDGQKSIDDPSLMPSKYAYATVGATNGSQSLKLTMTGWGQTLSIKLSEAQRADFMANTTFSIDYSVAADTQGVGGFARIQGFTVNADGIGWTGHDLGDTENFWFWNGSPERTQTFTFDYSSLKASINPNPSYIELILTTNGQRDTDPASPFALYFANAQLTGAIPEPASMLLLGAGGLLALRKKK